jgi:starch-binding outer membrane protein, SusD/RagB family
MNRIAFRARGPLALAALGAVLGLGACSRDELLAVNTPDQITPEAAASPSGAAALRVSALGNFANFYSGDNAGNGVSMRIASGLLGDEMTTSRGGTEHMDSRAVNENTFPATVWSLVGSAQTQLIRARKALGQYGTPGVTNQSQMAQMQALEGYVYLITGELYCNGVPIGNADDANPQTALLTNAQLFVRAIAAFDSALTLAPAADATNRNLAIVGKARALVDQKQFAQAATLVAAIPTNYQYFVQHSRTTIINDIYDWMVGTRNFGVVNREGINGQDYLSAGDPRIRFGTTAPGQDGSPTISPTKYPNPDSPVELATGIEARMIEAEAALEAGNISVYLAHLNTARATLAGLAPLTDPGTTESRVNLLFRERAFWFWLTGHRVGDLRRLIRQYGRNAESVFPTGAYFKGGVYGSDVNLIPSNAERNNSGFPGCANRNA